MASLYGTDFYSWCLDQARALRRAAELRVNTPDAIDWLNIAEEMEGMARTEARELRARYVTLLLHLLKWRYRPTGRGSSWEISISRERDLVPEHLDENPGLKPRRQELFEKAYRTARLEAARETGLRPSTFPEACPFTLEQALDPDFWP